MLRTHLSEHTTAPLHKLPYVHDCMRVLVCQSVGGEPARAKFCPVSASCTTYQHASCTILCMQSQAGVEVSHEDFVAAEPDALRTSSAEIVKSWNE